MLVRFIGHPFVNFIHYAQDIPLLTEVPNVLQFFLCENFTQRIIWSIDNDGFSILVKFGGQLFFQQCPIGRMATFFFIFLMKKSLMSQFLSGFFSLGFHTGRRGMKTGMPPASLTIGSQQSKKGSIMITSSPGLMQLMMVQNRVSVAPPETNKLVCGSIFCPTNWLYNFDKAARRRGCPCKSKLKS